MKIAFIHNIEFEIDSRAQKEVSALLKAGHHVLFCGWNKEKNGSIEKKTIETRGQRIEIQNICYEVKKGKGLKENLVPLVKYEFSLIKWLVKNIKNYDAIHVCSLDIMFVALTIARIFGKKIVYDIYDDYADSHSVGSRLHRIIKKIDAYFIKRADVMIICSEKRIEQLASKEFKKLVVIHNTPDISTINSELIPVEKNDKLKIAYVGNLNDGRMVYEIAEMISKSQHMEFHCAGSGLHEQDIKTLAKNHSNIFFYGRLTYEQTLALESNCDVIPAIYDPSVKNHTYAAPNKFYEALFLGKPTIMIHNTGMDGMVDKYNTGITTEFSLEHIKEALNDISENLPSWKARETEIKEIYNKLFSWDIMESRLLNIYGEVEN